MIDDTRVQNMLNMYLRGPGPMGLGPGPKKAPVRPSVARFLGPGPGLMGPWAPNIFSKHILKKKEINN